MKAAEVTTSIAFAETPAQKAVATRKLNLYIKEQELLGHNPSRTKAAIKAIVTRRRKSLALLD